MSSSLSQSCEFVKKRDDTVLRVVWSGDLQLLDKGPKYDVLKPLTALLAVAALMYADPNRVAIWNYVAELPGCWRKQIYTSLL